MQKWCQKDARPTLPANPKEGSVLRREHTEKQQTTENQQWLRKMECERWGGVQRRARSPSRIPTRLGRQRPGADLSCLRQYTRTGPQKREEPEVECFFGSCVGASRKRVLWKKSCSISNKQAKEKSLKNGTEGEQKGPTSSQKGAKRKPKGPKWSPKATKMH